MQRRRHRDRRVRRILLWCGLGFLVVQLGVGWMMAHDWSHLRFGGAKRILDELTARERTPDIICLGSSRLHAALDSKQATTELQKLCPDWDGTIYNASVGSGDPIVGCHLLERMFQQGLFPRLLILEISPEMLARNNRWLPTHVVRHLSWSEIGENLDEILHAGGTQSLFHIGMTPVLEYREQLRRELLARLLPHEQAPAPVTLEEEWRQANAVRTPTPVAQFASQVGGIRRWLRDYRIDGLARQSVERLIARCRDANVHVLLVAVPLSTPHRALYTPVIETEFRRYLASLNAPFLDYRNALADSLFADHHHLNDKGGRHFTQRFVTEVLASSTYSFATLASHR